MAPRTHRRFVAVALAALLSAVPLSTPLAAQGPVGTGVNVSNNRDQSWDVGTGPTPAFVDAYLVTSNPGWQAFTGPQAARWISFDFDASGPGGSPYTFRTTFDLTGYDASTATFDFRCMVDNTFLGWRLNGAPLTGGGNGTFGTTGVCGSHAAGFGSTQTVNAGFLGGLNTLEFVTNGDATTDGLIVDITNFSARQTGQVVPEPATWALLATGLVAVGGVGMRRRRATA